MVSLVGWLVERQTMSEFSLGSSCKTFNELLDFIEGERSKKLEGKTKARMTEQGELTTKWGTEVIAGLGCELYQKDGS